MRVLTESEARTAAGADLDAQQNAMTDAAILSVEETEEWREDRLIVTRYVYCIDNIAKEQDFWVKTGSEGNS